MGSDIWLVVEWWATLFLFGAFAYPLTRRLFAGWYDRGYLFAKAVGIALVTYVVYVVGSLRMLPFTSSTIWIGLAVVFGGGLLLRKNNGYNDYKNYKFYIFAEELFFFSALLFWSWIKGHQPAIHDLEKFMDFGFTKSVLNSVYFPSADIWYAGGSINYYYFGHIALATLTKLSGIDLAYTFNLMLASIFAFTATMSFSIGFQIGVIRGIWGRRGKILAGVLTAFLVTLAGNLQTIYAFTRGYTGDPAGGPPAFWKLGWSLQGLTSYWYANATRFIPYTIHEFPSYSFVVSDVHGHVLSLPFVLLAIALLVHLFSARDSLTKIVGRTNTTFLQESLAFLPFIFYGFLVGVLLMTNALDGPIYFALFTVLAIFNFQFSIFKKEFWRTIGIVGFAAGVTSLPFLVHFKSFVSGIGVNCPPAFLQMTKVGPFLFEGAEKCQRSALWMLLLLWGFFLYCGGWFIGRLGKLGISGTKRTQIEKILLVFFVFSIGLILFPEVLYFKDIYPMHFRSNTMFKLGYQAFIMFSIVSAYVIVAELRIQNLEFRMKRKLFFIGLIPLLFLVSIYPIFSVRSYFNNLTSYEGLYGLTWIAKAYPDDYVAINWLNRNVSSGVIVEADGDSYTDYARFSAFTGLPTIIGWPVHEWLWRGSYDIVSPRREDVKTIYESADGEKTRELLAKYHVQFVIIGALERSKYPSLSEEKFRLLGSEVFRSGQTVIYRIRD